MWRQETGVNVSKRDGFGGTKAKLVRGGGTYADPSRGSGRSVWRQEETGVDVLRYGGFRGMKANLVRGSGTDSDLVRGSGTDTDLVRGSERSVLRQESETGVGVLKQFVLMRLKRNGRGQSRLFGSSAQSNKWEEPYLLALSRLFSDRSKHVIGER